MKHILLAAVLGGLSTSGALAGEFCGLDAGLRFSCTFEDGAKALEVCDMMERDGRWASYGFFAPGTSPELSLMNEMVELGVTPWNGVGRATWEAVTFHSDDWAYRYEVWASVERAGEGEVLGGVNVYRGEDLVAAKDCDAGSVTHDLAALIEAVEGARVSP